MNSFFTSDYHFNHPNIIKYEKRPFYDVEEMNEHIVARHNQTVGKRDQVFFLGDFAFGSFEAAQSLLGRLHGRLFLLLGNHDRGRSVAAYGRMGWDEVSKYPVVYKKFYILSHEPVYLNDSMPYANVHGHMHSKSMSGGAYVNVSVEQWDYTPVPWESILARLKYESIRE